MGAAVTAEKPNPQDIKPLPQAWLQGGTLATTSWTGWTGPLSFCSRAHKSPPTW